MLVFFALGNAKVVFFALGDAKVPNASSFASQWNIGCTFMDDKKAFETLYHNILLKKLLSYISKKNVVNWFKP